MRKRDSLIFVLLLFVCLACTNRVVLNKEVRSVVVPVDREDPPSLFDSFFVMNNYVCLETLPECLIRKIGKIVFYEGKIYILDERESRILVFSEEGAYLSGVDRRGRGPDEYLSLVDFSIKDNILYLLDRSGGKLLRYNLDGSFIGSTKIAKGKAVQVLADGKYALNMELGCADNSSDKQYYNYMYYEKSEYAHRDVVYNQHLCGLSFSLSEGGNGFYNYSDSLFTLFPFNDTIYSVDKQNGYLEPYLSVQIGNKKVEIDSEKAEIETLRKQGISTSLFSFFKWENRILFSYYYQNKNRQYTLVDATDNSILFNGAFALDTNKIPVRIIAYDSDREINRVLSLAYPFELLSLAKRYAADSEVLKQISMNIAEEDNPILLFYSMKKP